MKETPLFDTHVACGAKMVDFAGWRMPVQYGSILDEVRRVRERCGLFDLCHMGRLSLRGGDALALAERLVTCFVGRIPEGAIRYGLLCREDGAPLDDVLVYREPDGIWLVVNAANCRTDLDWIRGHAGSSDVEVLDQTGELAMVALQGRRSQEVLQELVDVDLAQLGYYRFTFGRLLDLEGVRISRTGYTGEDGFEVYFPVHAAHAVWQGLLEAGSDAGLAPIGLGARDTLRLEAGMPLYGHEIDLEHNPIEAGLHFGVSFHEEKGEWIGREALERIRAAPRRKLVGITTDGPRVPRQGYGIFHGGREVGQVCSGAVSPTLGKNIGSIYLPLELARAGERVEMDVRGKRQACSVVDLPFYSRTRK